MIPRRIPGLNRAPIGLRSGVVCSASLDFRVVRLLLLRSGGYVFCFDSFELLEN